MLVLIIGPSGSGKDTIVDELCKRYNYKKAVSATTRKPRDGEVDGEHYYFLDSKDFLQMDMDDQFVEIVEYNGNWYGTLKSEIESNDVVLLVVEIRGAIAIKNQMDCLSIFVEPPSLEELARRLKERGTEDENTIASRLLIANQEMRMASQFDMKVVNNNLDAAVDVIRNIINNWDKN